jgi:hypothetical protein
MILREPEENNFWEKPEVSNLVLLSLEGGRSKSSSVC